MPELLHGLNQEQLAAVTLPPVHALILAGAGSGKTRVLTTRIAWLISTGQVTPHGILAVTFTNKAAKEMVTRIAAMLPINTRGMWIGTFHGLCNRMLRAHYREANLPQLFQILDVADQLAAIKRLLKALNVDTEKFAPRELQWFINGQKEQGLRAAAVEAHDDYTKRRVELYAAYEAQCQKEGVVDFAELLLRCYELLARNEPLRHHYQTRFTHVLVDEFQDTNVLQYKWLKLFAPRPLTRATHLFATESGVPPDAENAGSGRLFCVGDDDQSIYGFRGAEIGNMRDFEREYQVRHLIRLEQNYRSHGNILDAANAIIKLNAKRLGKNLWTEAGAGEPLRVFAATSDFDEAHWIAEEVRALEGDGLARREIALLYRSNAQSRILEHQLFAAGIPYRVYGGLRFFERQEIKHALAYLRLIANPDDDTAFARVVNFPPRGIGARSLENLQDVAAHAGCSLYAAIRHLSGRGGLVLSAFARLVDELKTSISLPLPELVTQVLEQSGLRNHYLNEKEGQERLANLDELINAAQGFVAEQSADTASEDGLGGDLVAFLAHAALEAGEHQAGEGDNAVQLMTVHAAKGLEFNVVFICGLEQGLFPHEQAALEKDGLEEERRLMYVAVTRARQRLYLSFAQTRMLHGLTRPSDASIFLDEIPPELLKWLTPRRRNGGYSWFDGTDTEVLRSLSSRPTQTGRVGKAVNPSVGKPAGAFSIGQSVEHAKFGKGVIVNAEGGGNDARVQVNFGREGTKWLALALAKLTPA